MDTITTVIAAICSGVVILAWFVLPASKPAAKDELASSTSMLPAVSMTVDEAVA